ncbi:hypothetical protein TREMEDRAFT_59040 [Tremella mesenterica DSM 1558]|uniref:uncharacterized protein n=1 Tax=Tremella mesenterica (strain ATCC 24925 / CBS 8224 / DSM 1558 / NBRC 9311 / NRRL Y-6157 / RJB 2259-6 / UBC 559-6) TaxID=578456 RepID=UPI0003F496D9|nr:uncharacterized protein TREMEDRAFT_59040 [Tremella mesenterica DSM 1558]EIW72877.1 hypothetical protein TREMEDRAFT_59040 [Tremella mesenterica DSM 1558]
MRALRSRPFLSLVTREGVRIRSLHPTPTVDPPSPPHSHPAHSELEPGDDDPRHRSGSSEKPKLSTSTNDSSPSAHPSHSSVFTSEVSKNPYTQQSGLKQLTNGPNKSSETEERDIVRARAWYLSPSSSSQLNHLPKYPSSSSDPTKPTSSSYRSRRTTTFDPLSTLPNIIQKPIRPLPDDCPDSLRSLHSFLVHKAESVDPSSVLVFPTLRWNQEPGDESDGMEWKSPESDRITWKERQIEENEYDSEGNQGTFGPGHRERDIMKDKSRSNSWGLKLGTGKGQREDEFGDVIDPPKGKTGPRWDWILLATVRGRGSGVVPRAEREVRVWLRDDPLSPERLTPRRVPREEADSDWALIPLDRVSACVNLFTPAGRARWRLEEVWGASYIDA